MKINRFFAVSAIGVTVWSSFFAGNCSGGTTGGSGTELSPEEWRRNMVTQIENEIGFNVRNEYVNGSKIDIFAGMYNTKHQDIEKAAEKYQEKISLEPSGDCAEYKKLLPGKQFSMIALMDTLEKDFYKDYAEKNTYWSGLSEEDKDKVMEAVDLAMENERFLDKDQAVALFIKHHDEYLNSGKKLSDKDQLADYIKTKYHPSN